MSLCTETVVGVFFSFHSLAVLKLNVSIKNIWNAKKFAINYLMNSTNWDKHDAGALILWNPGANI